MSVCNIAVALKLPLVLLCSPYDNDLVQRAEHQTMFYVACDLHPGIRAAPQTIDDAVVHTSRVSREADAVHV